MATITERFRICFPDGYDAQRERETPSRGYLSDVIVEFDTQERYPLFFIDPIRLQQELADNVQAGQPLFAEPNLVVLPCVTTESIRQAVDDLVRENLFEHLKPL